MRSGKACIAAIFGWVAGLALVAAPVLAQTATPAPAHLPPGPCAPVSSLISAGNLAWIDHDDSGAAADFNRAIAGSPRCGAGWIRRAEFRYDTFDYDEALADAKVAVTMAPRDGEAYAILGEAEMRQWEETPAANADPGGSRDKRAVAAIADLSRAIDLGLKDSHILLLRAKAYDLTQDDDRAIADCDSAMALVPGNIDALVMRGYLWSGKGDDAQALADFARVRAIDPSNNDGYVGAAEVDDAKGEIDAAIAILSEGIARPGHGRNLYSRRASLYERKGDFTKAIADWTSDIAEDRFPERGYMRRAAVYAHAGDFDHALADAGTAIQMDPKDGEAYLSRGEIEIQAGKTDAASQDFDRARALEPDRSMWIAYAACWARANAGVDLDKALADCTLAIAQGPTHLGGLVGRGLVHFRLGQYDAAIADYTAALTSQPKFASSLFGRALAEQKKGMTAEAKADLAAARALDATIDQRFKAYGLTAD